MRFKLAVCAFCLALIACSILSVPNLETVVEPTESSSIPKKPSATAAPTVAPPTSTKPGYREISWKDARSNIGETVRMCGEAVTVMFLLDGRTVVNLGEIPAEGGVIVVITDSNMFPKEFLDSLYGDEFCVTGEVVLEDSKVGVFVTDPGQIESDMFALSNRPANQVFRDDFLENLQAGWEWQNENPSFWKITSEGWLQIIGEDDSLLAVGVQSNLLCRGVPDGDIQVTVHVFAEPSEDFQQATLYLFQDSNNYVAINRGYCSPCVTRGGGIFMEYKIEGSWNSYNFKTEDPDVFLRLVKKGNSITGYYALEDGDWHVQGKVENALVNPRICLGVTNVDSEGINADLVGEFDYIEISVP